MYSQQNKILLKINSNNRIVSKILKNGDKYVGEVRNNKFNGNGIYTFGDGNKYTGQFVNDNFNGFGTIEYFNGGKYCGEWKSNKFHGKGTFEYANGINEIYKGDWKNGLEEGIGYHYNNNSKIGYMGYWAKGKRQGIGINLYPNAYTRVCLFDKDERISPGTEFKFIFKGLNEIGLQNITKSGCYNY